ncbi:TPA: hypothetical protein ACPQXG_000051 [Streptococcus mutans]
MAESFDYMTWIKDFERVNGRPPTSQEVEEAQGLVSRYITEQTTSDWANQDTSVSTTSSSQNHLESLRTKGLGWFWKTLLVIISTPIYLIKFFFNLIKATIGVFVIWFVSKFVLFIILGLVTTFIFGADGDPSAMPEFMKSIFTFFYGDNIFTKSIPDFFPHPTFDGWLIGLTILIFALLFTFLNYDEHS